MADELGECSKLLITQEDTWNPWWVWLLSDAAEGLWKQYCKTITLYIKVELL